MTILTGVLVIDLRHRLIPNQMVMIGIAGGILVIITNLRYPFQIYGDRNWFNPIIGGLLVSGVLLMIAIIGKKLAKQTVIGMGDIKIFIPIGIFLGWRLVLVSFFLSAFLGTLVSILGVILGFLNRKDPVPYGPFIALATFLTILFGGTVWDWYFNFGLHYYLFLHILAIT
jgi:leader peptidase (prepilin peptidase)/N-methyltransferase